jgi:hypothetical protein
MEFLLLQYFSKNYVDITAIRYSITLLTMFKNGPPVETGRRLLIVPFKINRCDGVFTPSIFFKKLYRYNCDTILNYSAHCIQKWSPRRNGETFVDRTL